TRHWSPPPPPDCPYTTLFRSRCARTSPWPLTVARPAIGWLASPKRRTEPRRAARPRGCRGSALLCAWTRRADRTQRRAVEESHRSEEHTPELQSRSEIVCRLL